MRAQAKTTNATWMLLLFLLVLGAAGGLAYLLIDDGEPTEHGSLIESPRPDDVEGAKMVLPPVEPRANPTAIDVPTGSARPEDVTMLEVEDGTPRGRILGRVVDAAQRPVEGATIEIFRGNSLISTNFPGTRQKVDVSTRSAQDGSFVLDAVPVGKDYVVVADHVDHAPGEVTNLRVAQGQPVEGVVIVLPEGAKVSGYVLTAGGSPIAGARVELYDSVANAQLRPEDRRPWAVVLTDTLGAFTFEHVSATNLRVRVEAEGYESQLQMVSYALEARPKNEVLTFRLAAGSSLNGRVVDERGAGVPEARLEATSITKDYQGNAIAFSDAAGYFVLDGMGEVPYQLRCTADGYSDVVRPKVLVSAGELLVEMQRRLSVTGFVHDRGGEPVSSFSLALMRAVPGREPALMNDVRSFHSADGSFEFDNLDPGSYAFQARVKGFAPSQSEAVSVARDGVDPPPVSIVVSQGASLRGRVVDSSGKPVVRALVRVNENGYVESPILKLFGSLSPAAENNVSARTDSKGDFKIENITPGTYQVRVEHDAWAPLVLDDVTLFDDGDMVNAPLELRMPPGAVIAGRALDPARRPMAFTEVQISQKTGWGEAVKTDANGVYSFQNLREGEYTLSLKPATDLTTGEPMNPLMMLLHAKQSRREVFVATGQVIDDFELQMTDT